MRLNIRALILVLMIAPASAQEVYGDARPDAPELAARGPLPVGVRTVTIEHADQLDILHVTDATPNPRTTRRLRLEIWYPAQLAAGQAQQTTYTDVLGAGANNPARPNTPFQFAGRASRDAKPDARATPGATYPLVIVSHGYPGSRLQMSYLTENLASKGYVVVAIDHPESTRADKAGFASTLLNRRLDDVFVLDTLAAWSRPGSGQFLAGVVDVERTALVGYSMGGYGALSAAGAGISAAAVAMGPGGQLGVNAQGDARYAGADPRIKAVVAFAPWGGAQKVWDAAGLAGVRAPVLFISGDQDDVAGYRDGVVPLFEGVLHAERYLLTYQGARHNVAPNPPPPAAFNAAFDDFFAYAEPAWDSRRINNINQHFVTAFLGVALKQQPYQAYLDLAPLAATGTAGPEPVQWAGFRKRTAVGLGWRHLAPQ
jgi:predicted dienelactone hydrolase